MSLIGTSILSTSLLTESAHQSEYIPHFEMSFGDSLVQFRTWHSRLKRATSYRWELILMAAAGDV